MSDSLWPTMRASSRRRPQPFRIATTATARIAQLNDLGIFPVSVIARALELSTRSYFLMLDSGLLPTGAAAEQLRRLYAIVHYAHERLGAEMPRLLRASSRSYRAESLGALLRTGAWSLANALAVVDALADHHAVREAAAVDRAMRRRVRLHAETAFQR